MKSDALSKRTSTLRRTRSGPQTRKQILDASLRLFSKRGFARTTVRDIARAAGITDAAIYYHFRSKRDLLVTITEKINMFGQKIITLGGRDGETSENSRGF